MGLWHRWNPFNVYDWFQFQIGFWFLPSISTFTISSISLAIDGRYLNVKSTGKKMWHQVNDSAEQSYHWNSSNIIICHLHCPGLFNCLHRIPMRITKRKNCPEITRSILEWGIRLPYNKFMMVAFLRLLVNVMSDRIQY